MKSKNSLNRLIKSIFSSDKMISYYSRPRLHYAERILFKKYIKSGDKVLDLFCGAGRVSIVLARMGVFVIGVDNNEKMIEEAKKIARKNKLKNVRFFRTDASKINSLKYKFDYVIVAENSLETVPKKKKREAIFKRIYSILKPNGKLIISFTPYFYPRTLLQMLYWNMKNLFNKILFSNHELGFNDGILYNKKFRMRIYYHKFTPYEIKKLIKMAGFSSYNVFSHNELDKRKNKLKNTRFYSRIRPFSYCYYVIEK